MLTRFKKQEVVERRIKMIKGPICIRPMFLHEEECVEGLIFVALLAPTRLHHPGDALPQSRRVDHRSPSAGEIRATGSCPSPIQ